MIHQITVDAYSLNPDRLVAGTGGSYGFESISLSFSEEWNGLSKKVTFYPPKGRPVSVVLTDDGPFDIPHEATARSGEIPFTVSGYRDGQRIYSYTGELLVLSTKTQDGLPSEEPTPSEKEQILSYVQDVKEMIDAGKIKGKDGYTPIKGVDYFDGKDGTSVAITEIDQTDEPGGESVVTFSDGKTLSVRNGLDGDDHLLVVTVNGTKASHTAAEINAFVQRGGTAALVLGGNVFHPQIIGAKMCRFSAIFNSASGATEWLMDVDASGTATFSNVVLDSLKNPNAITFTGAVEATYDGSRAVEVVIPEGEKQNLLVVMVDDGMRASHSATDVDAFVKNGGAVVLVWSNKVLHAKSVDAFLCRFGTMFNSPEGTTEWVMDVDQYGVAVFSDVICSALPSPNPIIFRGAVNETYDGSEEVIVEIPEGGGGNSVYFSEEEPTDAKTGDFWYDESEGEEVTQPLTFTGAVEATYDGSKPVEVDIPKTDIPRIEMESADTTATIEPNTLYVFPEMASLEITIGGTVDTSIVQEYRFRFTSGATATTLTLPADVVGEMSVEANKVYEVSILDGYLVSQSWEVS